MWRGPHGTYRVEGARFAGAPWINLRCAAVDGPAPLPPRVHLGSSVPCPAPCPRARWFSFVGRSGTDARYDYP